jgi:hypothetical protein
MAVESRPDLLDLLGTAKAHFVQDQHVRKADLAELEVHQWGILAWRKLRKRRADSAEAEHGHAGFRHTLTQIIKFSTQANSGKMPGAALTAPAGAAAGGTAAAVSLGMNLAAGAGKTYTSAMSVMAQRSAKRAVACMSQYFASQGWIPQSMVQTTDTGSPSF